MQGDTDVQATPPAWDVNSAVSKLLQEVDVQLTVEVGTATLPVRHLLALTCDSIIRLDRRTDEPVHIFVNGKLFARGEIVATNTEQGVRITELAATAS